MLITRRFFLSTAIPAVSLLATNLQAKAAEVAPNFIAPRALGNPNAKVHVQEWFSLTCAHCGRFAQTVFPEIEKQYINTGKVYYIFKDFPLDKIALMAAIVARSLPVDQYKPFVFALLDNLDQWAFKEGADPAKELQKYATLAGMNPAQFDQVTNDTNLRDAILAEVKQAEDKYKIDSTPTFIFNGQASVGELTIEDFGKNVTSALSRQPTP
ncbi:MULTISPECIES: thioredoxin domain-containing protein [Commensalibacter]|uniref:DSBA oxidoreductase n=2 Tax=Commensalibacter TaxID=1079922 RepID=W7DMA4_9PROT|nr:MULTISPECIES: thioredoxin domain-containing protein [Commensalibacter]EUK18442.1 DSBA oxidoreductase [Commensalibacter papalotli (ex Servin-Garciduenas et al. 2014)]CAI3933633.1 Protein thiol-disulfide isomerase DsbC (DsbG) (PDB:2HI7) [Commensalibacter papalotli (ex Botero et al. 2024)]CAI3942047.1 Protein thiol-disulfide isomerase DsbC (DsbG) (PDB:2HI7) [Commensalibacter papalotli (ex Botero et al. 2024)]